MDGPPSSSPSALRGASDPRGPVFISYRWNDGGAIATALARVLRAHGVPVWLDKSDLPPGDISQRLEEALSHGLSGGALVATPDVEKSPVIRTLEAPTLLALAKEPTFSLAVVNCMTTPDSGHLDIDRAKNLLGIDRAEAGPKQYESGLSAMRDLGRWMALRRLTAMRVGREHEPLVIDIQSRAEASARAVCGDLVFRTVRPDDGRVPGPEVWEDLKFFLAGLPRMLADANAREVMLRGGSHLSMAFALGAALPATTTYQVAVVETSSAVWKPQDSPRGSVTENLVGWGLDCVSRMHRGSPLAVFVDFNTNPDDGSFDRHVDACGRRTRRHHFSVRARLSEVTGPEAVARAARRIRRLAARQGISTLDLFLKVPWPAAALLGRELNTLTLNLYEFDGRGGYRPVIRVASGEGPSAVQAIL